MLYDDWILYDKWWIYDCSRVNAPLRWMNAIWWRGEYMTATGWMLLLYEWMLYDKWMTLWLLQDGCFSKMNECCLMNDEYMALHDEWI